MWGFPFPQTKLLRRNLLTPFNSEELTSWRDNPPIDSALASDRITLDQWLFHGAILSVAFPSCCRAFLS
jgi:hypothetical protein